MKVLTVSGRLAAKDVPSCPCCGKAMEGNGQVPITLWHLPLGMERARIEVMRRRWACRECGNTLTEEVPFGAPRHRIARLLLAFVQDLLALGQALKAVSLMTGLHRNVVKEIDRARLEALYTEEGKDGERALRKPERQACYLGIDESRLHNGHKYATVIIDLETGHVLWLAYSKRKEVVYGFCDHVGEEWMSHVEAIACDMNADFERAFLERFPHLDVVYDRFHFIKNSSEKIVSEVRKDEQTRLREEGDGEAAGDKHSKYILMSGKEAKERKGRDAREGKAVSKGSGLFGKEEAVKRGGARERYRELISIAERAACRLRHREGAARKGLRLQTVEAHARCDGEDGGGLPRYRQQALRVVRQARGWPHRRHRRARQAHISGDKVEGTNQMIKTLRRAGYGYPDDEYFFLKIFLPAVAIPGLPGPVHDGSAHRIQD